MNHYQLQGRTETETLENIRLGEFGEAVVAYALEQEGIEFEFLPAKTVRADIKTETDQYIEVKFQSDPTRQAISIRNRVFCDGTGSDIICLVFKTSLNTYELYLVERSFLLPFRKWTMNYFWVSKSDLPPESFWKKVTIQ